MPGTDLHAELLKTKRKSKAKLNIDIDLSLDFKLDKINSSPIKWLKRITIKPIMFDCNDTFFII